jgi:hypothetical protein
VATQQGPPGREAAAPGTMVLEGTESTERGVGDGHLESDDLHGLELESKRDCVVRISLKSGPTTMSGGIRSQQGEGEGCGRGISVHSKIQ